MADPDVGNEISLASLIAPVGLSQFTNGFWGKKWLFVDSSERALNGLSGLARRLASRSVRELLQMGENSALVMHHVNSGDYRGTRVATSEAFDFYQSGMTLYFDLSSKIPEVSGWMSALARDLGQRRSHIKVSIFASPLGSGTECHFDATEQFTIHLRGAKRWSLAPNTAVVNTMERFTVSSATPPTMGLYSENGSVSPPPLPEQVVMRPGCMLYVPRGYWHAIEVLEEPAVSLNFYMTPQTWFSFLIPLLERAVLADKEWRETVTGVSGSPAEREIAREKAYRLITSLPNILSELTPEDLVRNPYVETREIGDQIQPDIKMKRSPTSLLYCSPAENNQIIAHVDVGVGIVRLNVSACLLPLCQWMANQKSVSIQEAIERFRDLPSDEIRQFLCALQAAGFLHGVDSGRKLTAAPTPDATPAGNAA